MQVFFYQMKTESIIKRERKVFYSNMFAKTKFIILFHVYLYGL